MHNDSKIKKSATGDEERGGKTPKDASSCRSFFAKEQLIIGLFCGK